MPKVDLNIFRKPKSKPKGGNKKRGKTDKKRTIGLVLLFAVGLGVLMYPTASNWINQLLADKNVATYEDRVSEMSQMERDKLIRNAEDYNAQLRTEVVPDAFAVRDGIEDKVYEGQLAVPGSDIMAVIEIPALSVSLPVYHYTTKEVLEKGAGHLFGSSLPVGGKSTHTVVTAHRGLPSMRLFTDLDLLKNGDEFYIKVLDRTFAYQVDQILTVFPEETQELAIKEGKDYATLITCTPYGVNSHRLLVRGHRIPYVPKEIESRASFWRDVPWWGWLIAALALAMVLYVIVWPRIRKKKKNEKKES